MANKTEVVPDPSDGLPAMVVGRWVTEEKHQILRRYIHMSHGARNKFSQRTYIDLFSGPGRVKVNHTGHFADGGPMAAWRMSQQNKGAFTNFLIADASPEFVSACKSRLTHVYAPGEYFVGFAHETIDKIVAQLPKGGLHFALLDPFNAGHLHFSIIEKLAKLSNIDIAVHLSTGDIQRNIAEGLRAATSSLDTFAPGWKKSVNKMSTKREMRQKFLEHWFKLVRGTGLNVCDTMYAVKNSKDSTMYHLCLLARHPLANRFWTDACNIHPTKNLF
jgi:three-Cys-motif partner protein